MVGNKQPTGRVSSTDKAIAQLDVELFREDALKRVDLAGHTAMAAWKGLTLVNGGAIVALFTLVGSGAISVDAGAIWRAFTAFVIGLAMALSSNICGYYGQAYYLQLSLEQLWNAQDRMHGREGGRSLERSNKRGTISEYLGIGTAITSLVAFVAGAAFALSAGLSQAADAPSTPAPKVAR